jgi:hypothetical protein
VGEVVVAFWGHPVGFQEDGLGVFEEVGVDPLADFEGDAENRRPFKTIWDNGFAGRGGHVFHHLGVCHDSAICSWSYGGALSVFALVAYDEVLGCVAPCCVAGRVCLDFFGQLLDVFGFCVFAPEGAAADLVVALEAGVCVFYRVGIWLFFFVFCGTLPRSSGIKLSGIGGWGCFLWNIGRLLDISVYLSCQRGSRRRLGFGSWLAFRFPGRHVESVEKSIESLEMWEEMGTMLVNDFGDVCL